ncbi:hypothetical protein [Aeromonas bivalvium]|uniref:hypothetical protein n=1 Tax=Aeromonas bivalvium TaxID=440079 RepID=UPI0038D149F4
MEEKKTVTVLEKIENRRGLWGLLSLILGVILGIVGTLGAQQVFYSSSINASDSRESSQVGNVGSANKSAIGKDNILISTENSGNVENTIIQSRNRVSFSEFSKAMARLDFDTIHQYEEGKDQIEREYQMAFEDRTETGKYVVKELFSKIRGDTQALEWLKHVFDMGFDVNSKIQLGDDESTSLFWLAVDSKAIDAALFLLRNGASPYSWHMIDGELTEYPRMAWPVEYVLKNGHLSQAQKVKLIEELIKSGASISNAVGIREELKQMGIAPGDDIKICELECVNSEETCKLVELFKKSYNFKYYRNSSSFFYPESYFIGVDRNIYIKAKGFGYPDSKYVDPFTLMVIQLSPEKDRTVLYSYDYEQCSYQSGKHQFRRNCWTDRYIDTDFDTGQINEYVAAERICKK